MEGAALALSYWKGEYNTSSTVEKLNLDFFKRLMGLLQFVFFRKTSPGPPYTL